MEKLKSRKLWITIVSGAVVALAKQFGIEIDPEQMISLGVIVAAYVGGQAVVDRAEVKERVDAQLHRANEYIAALTQLLSEVQAEPEQEE